LLEPIYFVEFSTVPIVPPSSETPLGGVEAYDMSASGSGLLPLKTISCNDTLTFFYLSLTL